MAASPAPPDSIEVGGDRSRRARRRGAAPFARMSETMWWVAVDVGNARVKFGLFAPEQPPGGLGTPGGDAGPYRPTTNRHADENAAGLVEPRAATACDASLADVGRLRTWLAEHGAEHAWWWIATVNRPATTRLLEWIRQARPADAITLLSAADLPLVVRVPRPDMVGIDRLLDALAANRLRTPGRPAVVVDVGTAITVDLIAPDGAFLGGAILPGIAMSARAMHEFTDLLPLLGVSDLAEPPPVVGRATEPAMRSGLFWGAVGAVRELVARMSIEAGGIESDGENPATVAPLEPDPTADHPQTEPAEVFLTGGAGATVAGLIGPNARAAPHLTLSGIFLAARAVQAQSQASRQDSP